MAELVPDVVKSQKVRSLIEKYKAPIIDSLPRWMDRDRFLRILFNLAVYKPELADCDQATLLGAIIQCGQLGLEPDDFRAQAYLVPFKGKIVLVPGYMGLKTLVEKTGKVALMYAELVYEKDSFEYGKGDKPFIKHKPYQGPDAPGSLTHVYARAILKSGITHSVVLTKWEVYEAHRKFSAAFRAGGDTPWKSSEGPMWEKTALRVLCKDMPQTIEVSQAVMLDERAMADLPQGLEALAPIELGAVKNEPKGKLEALTTELRNEQPKTQASEPAPLLPPTEEEPPKASEAQTKAIFAIEGKFKKFPWYTPALFKMVARAILGRPITSHKELTKAEAATVIEFYNLLEVGEVGALATLDKALNPPPSQQTEPEPGEGALQF